MFNRKTLIDPTGNRFRVFSPAQGKPPKGLKSLAFRNATDARRFLQRFNAPADYWRQLLTGLNLELGHPYQKRDALQRVAEGLAQGRLKLYGVPRPTAQTHLNDASAATLKTGDGAWLQFAPAIKAMGPISGRQQSYTSLKQARTFLNSLNLSDEQLQAIAKQAELPTASLAKTTDARLDQLAKALVDETVVLFRQTPYTKPPAAPIAEPVASAPGNRPVDLAPPPLRTWVEIQLLDDQGNPVSGEAYWIICPEGQKHEGSTNGEGKARVDGILQGTCQVAFPNIEGSGIHQCAANVDCCTPAETDTDAANDEAATGAAAPAQAATESEATTEAATADVRPLPIAETEPETETAWAEFQLEDSNGAPIADRDYILVDPDGNEHRGKTDASGSARVENLTPGECEVRFLPLDKTTTSPPRSNASTGSSTAIQEPAASTEPANDAPAPAPTPAEPPEEVPDNYVDVAYEYADGSGVAGARFSVIDTATGAEVASGTLPASGEMRVAIPEDVSTVEVFFFDDPEEVAIVKESKPEIKEDPPAGWLDRMTGGLKDGADWTWELLQGDFNENPSVGQIITNAILTMIPVVDQFADARDLMAAIKQLAWDKRYDETGPWVGFFFTLIGLVPTVGSALKGILKLVWEGAKLDAILKVFNFFMKGNGVKWLKELRAGKLAEYSKQAAQIGHDVMDVVINQLRALKGKLPQWFDDTHAQIQELLNTLQTVKGKINGQFESIAQDMNAKLGKILSDAGEKIGIPGSAKGKVVKKQDQAPPPKSMPLSSRRGVPPKSLDDAANRLKSMEDEIAIHGYQPKYSDAELLNKVKSGEVANDRYLISFQSLDTSPDAKLAFQRDSGLAPVWATSFDQLEAADSDPKLIAEVLGTKYDPSKKYVLHIIDRGENLDQFAKNTQVPTWEAMNNEAAKALATQFDEDILREAMTNDYQKVYAKNMDDFWKAPGADEFNDRQIKQFASTLPKDQREIFLARHAIRKEFGANNEFTGNGLTASRAPSSNEYGVVETITIENNPPTISELTNSGMVKTVELF